MLRASLGVFRAVGVRQAAPARASARASTYSTAGQLWKRQISQKSGSESTPWRLTTTSRQASQTAWQRIGGHSPFSRAAPSKTAFRGQRRNFHSSKARNSESKTHESTAEPSSLSARLKKLSREYGWSAVGIYFALSVLDFPFCFLLVQTVGTDRIAAAEHFVLSNVKKAIPTSVQDKWHEYRAALKQAELENLGDNEVSRDMEMAGWGVKEAEEANQTEASLATQLALAYAIHKSFIFVRVPLTAAVTPKVVKVLRGWGWQIGKRTKK